jgi:hypothetical protein
MSMSALVVIGILFLAWVQGEAAGCGTVLIEPGRGEGIRLSAALGCLAYILNNAH